MTDRKAILDVLDLLARIDEECEFSGECGDEDGAIVLRQCDVMIRKLAREAGYPINEAEASS